MNAGARVLRWGLIPLAVAALAYLGFQVWTSRPSARFDKIHYQAPDFSFQDQEGKTFSERDLQGKVWVVDFIFTRCAGSCPMLTHQLSLLQDAWKGNPDFRLVTFSVDPDHDTVKELHTYAQDYRADPGRWVFLTGKKKDVYRTLLEGFKVAAGSDPQGGEGFEFVHSTEIMLVDGRGMIRGFYNGQDAGQLQDLRKDIRHLMSSRNHT